MREVDFSYLPPDSIRVLEEIDDAFLGAGEGALSAETVDEIIDRAIIPIETLPDTPLLVRLSAPERLWFKSIEQGVEEQTAGYDDDPDMVVVSEIDAAFSGIRQRVAMRLRTQFPDAEIVVLGRQVDGAGRVYYCEDGTVAKLPIDHNPYAMGFGEPLHAKRDRIEALRILYSLPARSNRIAYNIINIDPTERAYQGSQIQRRLPITTLQDELDSQNPPTFNSTMNYFAQAVEGVSFLADNNLRLTDLKPHNIAIDRTTDTALLFDFDGLRPADKQVHGYPTNEGWRPPERAIKPTATHSFFGGLPGEGQNISPITTSEMAYELGVSLTKILESYDEYPPEITLLAIDMTQQDPTERPELKTVTRILAGAGFGSYADSQIKAQAAA